MKIAFKIEDNGKRRIAKNKMLFIWFYNIYSHFAQKYKNEFFILPGQLTLRKTHSQDKKSIDTFTERYLIRGDCGKEALGQKNIYSNAGV
jgi:hypothetical protein